MKVHHVAFRTANLQRATDFYRDVVGLSEGRASPGRSVWLRLERSDSVLMLEQSSPEEPEVPPGSMELLAFAVNDEEKKGLEDRLAAANVVVEDRTQHTIYFRDPDGRRIGASTHPLLRDDA